MSHLSRDAADELKRFVDEACYEAWSEPGWLSTPETHDRRKLFAFINSLVSEHEEDRGSSSVANDAQGDRLPPTTEYGLRYGDEPHMLYGPYTEREKVEAFRAEWLDLYGDYARIVERVAAGPWRPVGPAEPEQEPATNEMSETLVVSTEAPNVGEPEQAETEGAT